MNKHLKFAVALSELLDNKFKVGRFSFGIDPLIGWIPGLGDVIGASLSFYLVWIGLQMKLPAPKIARMIGNIFIDLVLGLIPIVGDVSDFFYKANLKNLDILKQYSGIK